MRKTASTLCAALCFFSLDAPAGFKADAISESGPAPSGKSWAFQFSSGTVNGVAKEYVVVYSKIAGGRYRLSELDWDIDQVFMAGGNLMMRDGRAVLNLGYWQAITDGGDGLMQDYDWFDETSPHWTEYSVSAVDVVDGSILDLNAGWEFVQNFHGLTARGLLGYKVDNWKWNARGGYGLYSSLLYVPYVFEDETVCVYKQDISVPYAGLSADMKFRQLVFSAYFLFSPLVQANTRDEHRLRNLTITDDFDQGDMFSAGASARYHLPSGWFVTSAVDFQKIDLTIGDAGYRRSYEYYGLESYEKFNDYSGFSNQYVSISLGLGRFF